jgi:hypothetical protein
VLAAGVAAALSAFVGATVGHVASPDVPLTTGDPRRRAVSPNIFRFGDTNTSHTIGADKTVSK